MQRGHERGQPGCDGVQLATRVVLVVRCVSLRPHQLDLRGQGHAGRGRRVGEWVGGGLGGWVGYTRASHHTRAQARKCVRSFDACFCLQRKHKGSNRAFSAPDWFYRVSAPCGSVARAHTRARAHTLTHTHTRTAEAAEAAARTVASGCSVTTVRESTVRNSRLPSFSVFSRRSRYGQPLILASALGATCVHCGCSSRASRGREVLDARCFEHVQWPCPSAHQSW